MNNQTLACFIAMLLPPSITVADRHNHDLTGDDTFQLEELIVTADRREQRALDVPNSIQFFDMDDIDHGLYENTLELIRAVPNANFSMLRSGTGESNFSLRGIGTTTINVDQAIGFYVDDIPVYSVSEFGLQYFDLDSIEVLRGPQGTLYGRNALGGVVQIKTNDPEFDDFVEIAPYYGSDNEKRISVISNGALSENILARFNFLHASHDERIRNIALGVDDVDDMQINAARAKLLLQPNDALQLLFSAEISDSTESTGTGNFDTANKTGVNSLRPSIKNTKKNGISLEAEYQFEQVKLISLTSVRHHDDDSVGSRPESQNFSSLVPFSIVFNNDSSLSLDQTTLTQEFRLESAHTRPFNWLIGTFFQYNEADRMGDIENVSTGIFERSFATTKDRSFAVFTDASYQFNPKFSLTAGARVSWDRKKLNYQHQGSFAPLFGGNFAPNLNLDQKRTFNDISPRLIGEFKVTPNINLYAKVSKGYKAGGFNTEFVASQAAPYKKESIWSYEAGLKSRLLNGRVEIDFNLFHMDWSDQQVLIFDRGITKVSNTDKSESRGMEFSARARPLRNLLLTAAIGYVDARFVDSPAALNIDDKYQPNTSKWSAAMTARLENKLFNNTLGFIEADLSYKDSFYWDVNNTLEEPSHTFINLSAGIETADYSMTLFAKNIADEEYRLYAITGVTGFFDDQAQPGHGRELGIKASLRF